MFEADEYPDDDAIEKICEQARRLLKAL